MSLSAWGLSIGRSGKTFEKSYRNLTGEIADHLVWIQESSIRAFLDRAGSYSNPIIKKLVELDAITDLPDALHQYATLKNPPPLLPWLADRTDLNARLLSSLLRFEDGIPLSDPEKGTFVEFLLDKGHVNYDDIPELLLVERTDLRRFEGILTERGFMSGLDVCKALAEFLGLPYLQSVEPVTNAEPLKPEIERFLKVFELAMYLAGDRQIHVCSFKPVADIALEKLEGIVGKEVEFALCPTEIYQEFVNSVNHERRPAPGSFNQKPATPQRGNGRSKEGSVNRHTVELNVNSTVEMVANLVQKAVDYRATDIHLEPRRDSMNIRYRVDGFLYEVGRVEPQIGREIISRIKILADMDITERRLPQDGHFRFNAGDGDYDMRLATIPTNFGERMEIRLAEGGKVFTDINQLGLTDADSDLVDEFIHRPHGIVLATGPVGSGKTTTLYSFISKLDRRSLNALTIEDPIEYIIPDANQIEVNYKVNFDFVHGLRAILRQDPDVILVGEIRDEETAKIAIRAGMTGMLVFSTLHANDAVGSVTTLSNFQINRFLIANALVGSLAQRLVRKICPHCTKKVEPDHSMKKALGVTLKDLKEFNLQRGEGCEVCFHTGYLGRTGIYEIFNVTKDIRTLIMEDATEDILRAKAIEEGLIPLKTAGIERIRQGVTTTEEFVRVLG